MFSVGATAACTFMTVEFAGFNMGLDMSVVEAAGFDMGFDMSVGFSGADMTGDGCMSFSEIGTASSELSTINTAKTFAIFNCLLTTIGIFAIVLMRFKLARGRKRTWLALRIVMYLSLWCCLFTFYIRQILTCDNEIVDCSLGPAGGAQVVNVLLLISICGLLFLTDYGEGPAEDTNDVEKEYQEEEPGKIPYVTPSSRREKVETETHLPDGTIEREVETTNPDGSKTIIQTIEKPDDEEAFVAIGEEGEDESSVEEPPEEEKRK
jgi:hypothetical protein